MRYVFKTKPYPHQVRALKFLLRKGGGGLQVPMRWGKSKVAIDYAAALYLKHNVTRALIVTVTSGLGVWEDQIAEHCPVPWRVLDQYGEILSEEPSLSGSLYPDPPDIPVLEFMVINYQNVYARMRMDGRSWVPMPNSVIIKFKPQLTVVDESHHIGNPTAVQSKMIRQASKVSQFKVFMTGTMFHRKPFYVFGQLLFYDDGARLGGSFVAYKKRVAVFGGYGNYEVKKYRNLPWMMRQVRDCTFMQEYVPPRPPVINTLRFDLTERNLEAYMKMYKDRVIELDGQVVKSEIILSMHLRLQQICGGYLRLPDGTYRQVGNNKLEMARDRFGEYWEQGIEKAVVGCRFVPELRGVAEAARKVGFRVILFHGGVPKGRERTRRIKAFQETDKPTIFISQISAGKESINLSAADTMMFYSLTESYVEHDQFSRRIELFEDKRTLQYDFLIARGTRDEVTYEAMRTKQDVATLLQRNPRLAQKLANKETS